MLFLSLFVKIDIIIPTRIYHSEVKNVIFIFLYSSSILDVIIISQCYKPISYIIITHRKY